MRLARGAARRALAATPGGGVRAPPRAPLVYYLVLSRARPAWELAGRANDFGALAVVGHGDRAGAARLPAAFALPAAAPRDFGGWRCGCGRSPRSWSSSSRSGPSPPTRFQGLALPLAVLAVLGLGARWRRARDRSPALAALLVVPGTLYRADELREAVNAGRQPFFLTDGEHAALRWLDRTPEPGGVLAPVYSGLLVPAYTRRETWVGAGSWTPGLRRPRRRPPSGCSRAA